MAAKIKQKKTIVLPIAENIYPSFVETPSKAKKIIDILYELTSPAARLNGFVCHASWLQNLLIANSVAKFRCHHNSL